jgi:hypothetical protein
MKFQGIRLNQLHCLLNIAFSALPPLRM